MTAALAESLFDYNLNVEHAIHIATMLAGEPSSSLEDLIRDGEMNAAAPLLGTTAVELVDALVTEELGWLLRDQSGWLVSVSAAMVGPWHLNESGDRTGRSVHLGCRISRWFKADTYEAAIEAAVEWAASDPAELVMDE